MKSTLLASLLFSFFISVARGQAHLRQRLAPVLACNRAYAQAHQPMAPLSLSRWPTEYIVMTDSSNGVVNGWMPCKKGYITYHTDGSMASQLETNMDGDSLYRGELLPA